MKKLKENTKDKIKLSIAIGTLLVIIIVVLIIIVQYQVEGEKNMPFTLSKITIISTAEGEQNTESTQEEKWNLSIFQNNDIYFFIDKVNEEEESIIDSVTIQNITVTKAPKKGTIKTYMPSSTDGRTFSYDESYLVDTSLTYNGGTSSNTKTLTIGNQGGSIAIRFSNKDVGKYVSNEDTEVKHDGSLITKVGTTEEEISFTVNFDFIIKANDIKYKTNITLNLPCEDLCEEGTTNLEITDMSNIIFKRVR